jgi:hypothetical protein
MPMTWSMRLRLLEWFVTLRDGEGGAVMASLLDVFDERIAGFMNIECNNSFGFGRLILVAVRALLWLIASAVVGEAGWVP